MIHHIFDPAPHHLTGPETDLTITAHTAPGRHNQVSRVVLRCGVRVVCPGIGRGSQRVVV